MASEDWLETFCYSSNNLCLVKLNGVKEERPVTEIDENRDCSNTNRTTGGKDDLELIYTDDEASFVSSSGVSVVSIDYENNEIYGLAQEKVDLSDIGDDESTVASFTTTNTQNIDQKAEIFAAQDNIENSNSKASNSCIVSSKPSNNVSNTTAKNAKIDSRQVSGNPAAEKKRKDLLELLRKSIATNGRYSVQVANTTYRLAEFHESVNQPELSVTLLLEALSIYSSKLGDSDEIVTETQFRIGKLKEELRDLDSALEFYCKALSMLTAMNGRYDEKSSTVRMRVARIYQMKGFHKESVKELKKSLRAFRDKYGDEHITVADTVDQIADAYSAGGNHDKANSVRGELVKLNVALHGGKSSEVAHSLAKLANTYSGIGDYQGALKVMKQAYVMYHEVEGSEAINTENTLEQIGYLYSHSGREEKAIKAHTSVAMRRKLRYGEESVEVAQSHLTLGKSYLKRNQFEKAMRSLSGAMTIFGKENEASNMYIDQLMEILHHIGIIHKKSGKPHQALKALAKELSIRKKMKNDDKLNIAKTLAVIGGTYYELKNYKVAYSHFLQSLELFDEAEGRKLQFADVLFSCGDVLKQMNNPASTKCYIEAIQIYKANGYGDEDYIVKKMLNQISGVKLSGMRNIEPSFKCTVLEIRQTRRCY